MPLGISEHNALSSLTLKNAGSSTKPLTHRAQITVRPPYRNTKNGWNGIFIYVLMTQGAKSYYLRDLEILY